jgi:hypothetical protein
MEKLGFLCYGQLLIIAWGFFFYLGALAVEEGEVQLQLATCLENLMLEDIRLKVKIGWSCVWNVENG